MSRRVPRISRSRETYASTPNLTGHFRCFTAVAAKAPRKNLPAAWSPGRNNKKKAKAGRGNPFKTWPTPKWQQNLHTFLGVEQPESSSSSSSAGASTSSYMTTEAELAPGSSGSSCQDECQGSSSNMATGIELLSGDITQLNSDSEDDD